MKRIKILYTIPNFETAGSGYALMKLIINLDKSKFEPMLVCLHDRGAAFDLVRKSGIKYYIFPYLSEQKPRIQFIKNIIKLSNFFRSIKPDIIFSYHYSSDYSEAIAARLSGSKFIYVKKNMGWYGPSYNQWKIKTFLSSAITVQNTDMMRDFFHKNKKARLISIGTDTADFYPRSFNHDLKQKFGISDNLKVVLCVANIIPKKGIEFLLHGFNDCTSRNKSVLMIVGDNDHAYGKELKKLKQDLMLHDQVLFTGKRFDVPEILSFADLFILPSIGNEGAPIAVQEAMCSGVIVVTTDAPGNRDQLQELPDQLIPPKDSLSISKAIDKFLSVTPEEKSKILKVQNEIIRSRYSLSEEVKKHEELYNELVNG